MAAETEGSPRGGVRKVQEKPDGGKFVTIPADLCEEVGIEKGDEIDFQYYGELPFEADVEKDGGLDADD